MRLFLEVGPSAELDVGSEGNQEKKENCVIPYEAVQDVNGGKQHDRRDKELEDGDRLIVGNSEKVQQPHREQVKNSVMTVEGRQVPGIVGGELEDLEDAPFPAVYVVGVISEDVGDIGEGR